MSYTQRDLPGHWRFSVIFEATARGVIFSVRYGEDKTSSSLGSIEANLERKRQLSIQVHVLALCFD